MFRAYTFGVPSLSIQLTIEPKVLLSYPSARDFTTILKTVSGLVDEAAIQVDTNGVHLKALDPSRIAMFLVDLPPEAFQEFNVVEGISIGLAVSNLVKIFRYLKKGDRLTIAANEEFVEVVVEGMAGGRRYRFRNIGVLAEEVPEISPEYDVEATILSSPFRTAVKELTDIASTIGITANNEMITFFDYDTRKSSVKLTTASGNVISLTVKKNVVVAYAAEYLSKIVDILSLSNIVDVRYGSEAPLSIAIEFSGGKAVYYLASKM